MAALAATAIAANSPWIASGLIAAGAVAVFMAEMTTESEDEKI